MAGSAEHMARLLYRSLAGTAGTQESAELAAWMQEDPRHAALVDRLQQDAGFRTAFEQWSPAALQTLDQELTARITARLNESEPPPVIAPVHRVHFLKTAWFRYAAVLLLIAATATFLYLIQEKPPKEITNNQSLQQPEIQPGGNKAILTLSDGSTIVLDSAANGSLVQQGNSNVIKSSNGLVRYESEKNERAKESFAIAYNTIATPKGGQYQIVLSDGSKVWLNASSSIHFPTEFYKDRRVTVAGEVYFEIAQNKKKPFFVSATRTEIQVLGTSFNVNAYPDEPAVKTSVANGRVKIGPVILQPGSAYVSGKVVATDIEQDIAWKNGWFSFTDADLPTVMRQLTRWYNVEVHYEGAIPTKLFNGKIDKNLSLSQVLRVLTKTRVNYSIENNRITIRP